MSYELANQILLQELCNQLTITFYRTLSLKACSLHCSTSPGPLQPTPLPPTALISLPSSLPPDLHTCFVDPQQSQEFFHCIGDAADETPHGGKESKLEKKPRLSNTVG